MLIYLSVKNNTFIAHELKTRGEHQLALYVDTVRYSLIAYCLGAYWLSRTYSELLYIMVGLSTAVTHMFVRASDERYVLFEKKDFLYAFLCTIGGWLFTKIFLYMAW